MKAQSLIGQSSGQVRAEVQIVVGLGTSSRILRGSPAVFVLSWNFEVTYALFGYFWVNLPDFHYFWVDFGNFWADFGNFWTDYKHLLSSFISRFLVDGSGAQ